MLENFSPGQLATLACVLEVSAPKPGNVHRGADFEDVSFNDFLASAIGLGKTIDANPDLPMGALILESIRQTATLAQSNTNLGMALLICPLAIASAMPEPNLRESLVTTLGRLDRTDAADVYDAIRLAKPGGIGQSPTMDIRESAPDDLLAAMDVARETDLIAKQYCNGFEEVFEVVAVLLESAAKRFPKLSDAIVFVHVQLMARYPDSLIARKCGPETAKHSSMLANRALDLFQLDGDKETERETFWTRVAELDFWLRSDGHRRNPGTTADLIAAGLFVALANGTIGPPF